MKQFINILLLLVISIPLASCQNKEKMRTKFEWQESMSCPLGYPAEVYSGGLISKDGNYTSIYLGTGHGKWGERGGGMRSGVKQIPNRLQATWVSYAEDCVYEIDTPIDYDKMLRLFNEGYYTPSINEDPTPMRRNYYEIIVGLAPGGVVVIWLSGIGRVVEVGRYQGVKAEVPQDEIDRLDSPNKLLFNKEWRQKIMKNPGIVPLEVQRENEGKPIPYGLWDSYRQKYNWKLEIELPDNSKVKDIGCYFFNGEYYELFGESLNEKYPSITSNYAWTTYQKTALPKEINFSWVNEVRYYGEIQFNEAEVSSVFKEVFKDYSDGEATLVISVNQLKTLASVKLVSGKEEKWITESSILVEKIALNF